MEEDNSFTKAIAKQLIAYLYHHDPAMDGEQSENITEGL